MNNDRQGARLRAGLAAAALLTCVAGVGCSRGTSHSTEPQPSATTISPANSAAPQPTAQTPAAAIDAWNGANNRHDLDALKLIYASQVDFYGQQLSSDKVIALKALAFEKSPDFRQALSDTTTTQTGDSVVATFSKAWTSHGAKRQIGASIELKLTNGRFLVTKESDSSTAKVAAANKDWSCGNCRETQNRGPDFESGDLEPLGAAWNLHIITDGQTRATKLDIAPQVVELGALDGWACRVGRAATYTVPSPIGGSSFAVEARQLFCAQAGGAQVRIVSNVSCDARGTEEDSDFMTLRSGAATARVELACSVGPR